MQSGERLKGVTDALKKHFEPEISALQEVGPALKTASRQVLTNAREGAVKTLDSLGKKLLDKEGKGISLLGKSAGLLAVNVGLTALTNVIHPAAPDFQTRAVVAQTVTGLINGGVGIYTAKKALEFAKYMNAKPGK